MSDDTPEDFKTIKNAIVKAFQAVLSCENDAQSEGHDQEDSEEGDLPKASVMIKAKDITDAEAFERLKHKAGDGLATFIVEHVSRNAKDVLTIVDVLPDV